MINDRDGYQRWHKNIEHASGADALLALLTELRNPAQNNELGLRDLRFIQEELLRALQGATDDNPDLAWRVLRDHVIPVCVQSGATDKEIQMTIHLMRDRLVDWMDQYDQTARQLLQRQIVDDVLRRRQDVPPAGILRTLWRVGFRNDAVSALLWDMASSDDEVGDEALGVLAALGLTSREYERLVPAVKDRIGLRYNRQLSWCARCVGDPEFLDPIGRSWLPDHRLDALDAVVSIARRHPDREDVQRRVWEALRRSNEPNMLWHAADDIDDVDVVPTLLGMWHRGGTGDGSVPVDRWALGRALVKCVRPRQLAGWSRRPDARTLAGLEDAACANTNDPAVGLGTNWQNKKDAWQICLSLGLSAPLGWVDRAVAGEDNHSIRREILDLLACFRLRPLPEPVRRWLLTPKELRGPADDRSGFSYIGSITVAQSTDTHEALLALLACDVTLDGSTLRDETDAIAALAVRHNDSLLRDILIASCNDARANRQEAAAAGIAALAAEGLLPHDAIEELSAVLRMATAPFAMARIAQALNILDPSTMRTALRDVLVGWTTSEVPMLAQAALFILAPHLAEEEDPAPLLRLGLRRGERGWDLDAAPADIDNRQRATSVASLYRGAPSSFAPALGRLLYDSDPFVRSDIAHAVAMSHGHPGQQPIPAAISQALANLAGRLGADAWFNDSYMFGILGWIAPTLLTATPWDEHLSNLPPGHRAALADALRDHTFATPEDAALALATIHTLLGDGQFAVRRSAWRALATLAPVAVVSLCRQWAQAASVEARVRGAEGCRWIPRTEGDLYTNLRKPLEADADPHVREAIQQADDDRRTAGWVDEYLDHVLAVSDRGNEEILAAWAYGQALSHIGDDVALARIEERLRTPNLAPHLGHWLRMIVEDLEKSWEEAQKKWPKSRYPWHPTRSRGSIEPGDEGQATAYVQWTWTRGTGHGHDEWGAVMWPVSSLPTALPSALTSRSHLTAETRLGEAVLCYGVGAAPRP